MTSNQCISVFGAGAWGTALASVLARNGNRVMLWGRKEDITSTLTSDLRASKFFQDYVFPDNLVVTTALNDAIEFSDDYLIVVPSHAFRVMLTQLSDLVEKPIRLAWGTKGFDPDTCEMLSSVAQQIFGEKIPLAVLSGPSFAKEVIENQPTAVNIASLNDVFLEDLSHYFHSECFRIYPLHDIVGVQIGGAVKNVMAIAVGIADGLGLGANSRCALITRGLAEMTQLGIAMGAQAQTFQTLAGVGDLILTCSDNQSRNRQFGLAIGSGKNIASAQASINGVVEGYGNVEQVRKLALRHNIEMPITEEIYQVLYGKRTPQEAVHRLLKREIKRI